MLRNWGSEGGKTTAHMPRCHQVLSSSYCVPLHTVVAGLVLTLMCLNDALGFGSFGFAYVSGAGVETQR